MNSPFINLGVDAPTEKTTRRWVKCKDALTISGRSYAVEAIGTKTTKYGDSAYILGTDKATGEKVGINVPSYYYEDMRLMIANPACSRAIADGTVTVTVSSKTYRNGNTYPRYSWTVSENVRTF